MDTSNKRTPKLLSLLLVVCMVLSLLPTAALAAETDVPINETNFPDVNFRSYVQESFDKDKNSILSEAEIANVTKIDVGNKNISSLKGVEHFTALKELKCFWNKLTQLDVTNNTALEWLGCTNNQLTQLDVTNNTALTTLLCASNQLTQLDISNNTALTQVRCGDNQLTHLDVSKNTALTELELYRNQLTQLDVTNNTALEWLGCAGNQVTHLDVSSNTALTTFLCADNQLTQLDVTNNTALEMLNCAGNQLTQLNLNNNTALTALHCTENKYTVNQHENVTLPGNFDASKVSNVVGGKFDTANNTFSFDSGVNEATYTYDTGYTGTASQRYLRFKIVYTAPEVPEATEPKPTEPKPTEPKPTEPKPTEPKPTEPKPTEPKPTEPKPTEPKPTEPKPTEPKPTEPKPAEPKPTEPETPKPAENPFTDVSTSQYFYAPVQWAVSNGITSGISANKFGPNINCTRGQIVTFLWAAAGKPEPMSTKNPFTDVTKSDYYYKAVLWAVENGITSGMSADKFGPNVTCTRAQAVTFLWAAQGKPVVQSAASFSDVTSSDYYYNAVKWAIENKVTAGVGNNRFAPSANCLRGQIVTFLYKAFA